MKKIIILTTALASSVLWAHTIRELHISLTETHNPIIVEPHHKPTMPPGSPRHLSVPRVSIHASINPVGIDANGLMEVPKTAEDVAWYEPGTTPGRPGNAVLAAHYDWVNGPAIFYRLGELQRGDSITVTDEHNQSWQFIVDDVVSYPTNKIPIDTIFAESKVPHLRLITCDGELDTARNSYPDRIVVSATASEYLSDNDDKNTVEIH